MLPSWYWLAIAVQVICYIAYRIHLQIGKVPTFPLKIGDRVEEHSVYATFAFRMLVVSVVCFALDVTYHSILLILEKSL